MFLWMCMVCSSGFAWALPSLFRSNDQSAKTSTLVFWRSTCYKQCIFLLNKLFTLRAACCRSYLHMSRTCFTSVCVSYSFSFSLWFLSPWKPPIPSWCILCGLVLTANCMSIFTQNFKCSFKSCGCSISLEMPELTYCRHWCFFLWQGEDSSWMVGVFFSGCPNFLSGQLKVRLCWLNCFCTLASRVFFYVLSLSLSFFFSVSVSVFYIDALSAWALTSNWRSINTFYKTWFLEFGLLARLSNHVIITTTLMVWQL